MALHIRRIEPRGSNGFGEWVSIANDGPNPASLTEHEITDYTNLQKNAHIYRFPETTNGGPLLLQPGQVVFVFTEAGRNTWVTTARGKQELHLFMGRSQPIWNNTGDVVYLRTLDGRIVDTMTVGDPARHPSEY
ncbi:MAG: lamin tail domain-containing protein [Actinomycetota bacterium]